MHRLNWQSLVAGYEPVDRWKGSMEAPERELTYGSELFLEGGPTADDVHQGHINDCYYLSQLMSLASSRPEAIGDLIEGDATGATVTLHALEDGKRVPKQVTVSGDLAHTESGALYGARVRHSEDPEVSHWWAEIEDAEATIHRRDEVAAAWWVPMLEKGLAAFAEKHGQYGEGADKDGYDELEFGHAYRAMAVLTGEEGQRHTLGDGFDQGVYDALVALNKGEGIATAATTKDQAQAQVESLAGGVIGAMTTTNMSKWSEEEMVAASSALDTAGNVARGEGDMAKHKTRLKEVLGVKKVAKAAPTLRPLVAVMGRQGATAEQDTGDIILQHEYAIVGARLVDKKGKPAADAAAVDMKKSTINLRDPMRAAEARTDGKAADGALDGAFTLTLAQFVQTFGQLDAGKL